MDNLSIIAVIGKNNGLGKDNKLLWHLPNDLKFFKETTLNSYVIMGYNTYISLPKKLLNRKYIILTHRNLDVSSSILVFNSKEDILKYVEKIDKEVFVIGGASIYHQFIDDVDKMYLTLVDDSREADTYFPNFNKNDWEEYIIDKNCDNEINYKHVLYKRKKIK